MAARCGLICKLSSLVVGAEGLFKAAPFQVAGAHFPRSLWSGLGLRSRPVEAGRGVRAGGRGSGWTRLRDVGPVFLELPQPGPLCGGRERSVTPGAVQKHGVGCG